LVIWEYIRTEFSRHFRALCQEVEMIACLLIDGTMPTVEYQLDNDAIQTIVEIVAQYGPDAAGTVNHYIEPHELN